MLALKINSNSCYPLLYNISDFTAIASPFGFVIAMNWVNYFCHNLHTEYKIRMSFELYE